MQAPIVDGLFREGEIATICGKPGVGKTWLAYSMALSIATGRRWLDQFETQKGKVHIVDSELHKPTIAGRIKAIADALTIRLRDYENQIEVMPLRAIAVAELLNATKDVKATAFKAVILDTANWLPAKNMYELCRCAEEAEAAIIDVSHIHDGDFHKERKTPDCRLNLRDRDDLGRYLAPANLPNHEEAGHYLVPTIRSFPPMAPIALCWQYPLWVPTKGGTN